MQLGMKLVIWKRGKKKIKKGTRKRKVGVRGEKKNALQAFSHIICYWKIEKLVQDRGNKLMS